MKRNAYPSPIHQSPHYHNHSFYLVYEYCDQERWDLKLVKVVFLLQLALMFQLERSTEGSNYTPLQVANNVVGSNHNQKSQPVVPFTKHDMLFHV